MRLLTFYLFLFGMLSACGSIRRDASFGDNIALYNMEKKLDLATTMVDFPSLSKFTPNESVFAKISSPPENEFRVLIGSPEFGKFTWGGVGYVVNGMVAALSSTQMPPHHHIVPFVLFPYFTGTTTKSEFLGTLTHIYNGHPVHSKLFLGEEMVKGKPIHVILLQADPRLPHFFDLEPNSYQTLFLPNHAGVDYANRQLYCGSAAAALLYHFRNQHHRFFFDIAHFHSYFFALTPAITKKFFPNSPPQLFHLHSLNQDQGGFSNFTFNKEPINMMKLGMKYADASIAISNTMIQDGLSSNPRKNFGLQASYTALYRPDFHKTRLFLLPNGISYEEYNPFAPTRLQTSTSKENFQFTSDIVHSKQKIKNHLASLGLIQDPTRPLFVFVGRYAVEKGIDFLDPMLEEINKNHGNCIIMGVKGFSEAEGIMQALHKKYASHKNIYIMKGAPKEEQFGPKNLGMLIRAASDFALVPSHEEAFGLVPLEFLSLGSIPITSRISGLQDTMQELALDDTAQGNSFNYNEDSNEYRTVAGRESIQARISISIQKAFTYYKLSLETKNFVSQRLIEEAKKYDWLASGGAIEKITEIYEESIIRKVH